MKRLLILPALLLCGCSVISGLKVAATLDKGDVLIPAGASDLTGDPSRKGDGVEVTIEGSADYAPESTAPCVPSKGTTVKRFDCFIGTITAGKNYRIATHSGTVTTVFGSGYRGSSALPVVITLGR